MTSPTWRRSWVAEKCQIADLLARGEAGGTYSEAVILTCAVLSALAAEVWPGQRIDRARFIELLVRLSPSPHLPRAVSVPLLIRHVESTPDASNAQLLRKHFLQVNPARLITGTEVDRSEEELRSICPELSPLIIRKHSYACLIYEQVRSSYAHEYRSGDKSDSWPMSEYGAHEPVSYVNRFIPGDDPETVRLIHFHTSWLSRLAVELAGSVDAAHTSVPRVAPAVWWIDGAT